MDYYNEKNRLLSFNKLSILNLKKDFLKKGKNKILIEYYKIVIIFIYIIFILMLIIKNYYNLKDNDSNFFNKNLHTEFGKHSFFYKYVKDLKSKFIHFNIKNIFFCFSLKFNIVKIEYEIGFYENKSLILPSDLILNYNLSIICHMIIKNNNIEMNSLPNIYQNKYLKCIEIFKIDEKIDFGIKLYRTNETSFFSIIYLFNNKFIYYNDLNYKNDSFFNPLFIIDEYNKDIEKLNNKKINETLKLKKSYIKYPYCTLKRKSAIFDDKWYIINLYNLYFCFCKGLFCILSKISQKQKYIFYLNIIDNNREVYQKTDYLFADFIFNDKSFDDTFPVFKEMKKENLPAHYVTENIDIYNEYCYQNEYCLIIIKMNKEEYELYGNFLEKYLTLLLKLKSVISGKISNRNHYSELFYNLEYITYISVGHGVCYFKDYLYAEDRLYGQKRNDKILIPPSNKIINIAKKYGWKDENIIKINLPRWDKYNLLNISETINKSIFVMFTWRSINKNQKISPFYLNNIYTLLTNDLLKKNLKKKKIKLYFSYHRYLSDIYFNNSKRYLNKYKYIKLIQQNEISMVLCQTDLVVTDFSSILFEMIYRRKPFIFYIPDIDEPKLEEIYKTDYYNLINSIKNGTIRFENKYANINKTIDKIIYYINNNFQLEKKLKKFYDSFSFKKGNNIKKFMNYLKSLK